MAKLSRVKIWKKEILTHTDLNAEFDNVIDGINDKVDTNATYTNLSATSQGYLSRTGADTFVNRTLGSTAPVSIVNGIGSVDTTRVYMENDPTLSGVAEMIPTSGTTAQRGDIEHQLRSNTTLNHPEYNHPDYGYQELIKSEIGDVVLPASANYSLTESSWEDTTSSITYTVVNAGAYYIQAFCPFYFESPIDANADFRFDVYARLVETSNLTTTNGGRMKYWGQRGDATKAKGFTYPMMFVDIFQLSAGLNTFTVQTWLADTMFTMSTYMCRGGTLNLFRIGD